MFFSETGYLMKISGVYRFRRNADRHATSPRDVCVLSYRLRGSARFLRDGAVWIANPDNLIFLPPKIAYQQESDGEDVIAVHLEIPNLRASTIETRRVSPKPAAEAFDAMHRAWENGQYYRCCGTLYTLLASVCAPGEPHSDTTGCAFPLAPALAAIRSDFSDPDLDIPALAARCGLSEPHFRRLFRCAYMMSPLQYLTRFRINKAKSALSAGYTVSDTAARCGFRDPKYFSTVFHRRVGVSPSAWQADGPRG